MANGLLITLAACVGAGQQAMMLYKSTMEYFKPMMRSLRKKDIPADLLAGIWIIVQDIKDRNYLHANNTYMSLAVGACRPCMLAARGLVSVTVC